MEDGGKAMPSPQQEEESVKKKIWRINAQEARFLRITNVPISTLLIGLWERVNLGQNAVLAVSMATSRAGAAEKEVPLYKHIVDLAGKTSYHLPVPVFTLISGGNYAGNNLAFKEEGLES